MSNIPIFPSIITASAGFIAAVIAQFISHQLTKKREMNKSNKEIYQKLYSSIIYDIYKYLDARTLFRRSMEIKSGINIHEIQKNIEENVHNNLMFANPQIISAYHSRREYEYRTDFSSYQEELSSVKLYWVLLNELYNLHKKTELFDKPNTDKLIYYCSIFLIWIIISEIAGENQYNVISYKHAFEKEKINEKYYRMLRKDYKKSDTRDKLISVAEQYIKVITNGTGEIGPHGKSYLEGKYADG